MADEVGAKPGKGGSQDAFRKERVSLIRGRL